MGEKVRKGNEPTDIRERERERDGVGGPWAVHVERDVFWSGPRRNSGPTVSPSSVRNTLQLEWRLAESNPTRQHREWV